MKRHVKLAAASCFALLFLLAPQAHAVAVDFYISVDDYTKLYIDGQLIASYDDYPWGEARASIDVPDGWHDIRLDYANRWGSTHLSFYYKLPGDTDYRLVPLAALRSADSGGNTIQGLRAEYSGGGNNFIVYGEGPIQHGWYNLYQGQSSTLWAGQFDVNWGIFSESLTGQILIGSPCPGSSSSADIIVNGHKLTGNRAAWVRYIAASVVPQLPGTREEKIGIAAITTWWSLKEGVLSLHDPIPFSLCSQLQNNGRYRDVRLRELEVCDPGRPWQVGIAGIQVPSFSESQVLGAIPQIWPAKTEMDVLADIVNIANLNPARDPGASILASDGDLKKSWLLRHPVVAFTLQEPIVTAECINASKSWCYGGGWTESRDFAPTRDAALASIEDLKCAFDRLSP
jgi:hypothetical protein